MRPPKPSTRWTRWLPLLYLLFGVAWILASDAVVGRLFRDTPNLLLLVGTFKGFAFVALTALLLALWWRAEQRHNAALVAGAEARASFAAERMAWMSRHANDVILLLDEDGRIIDCNERAEVTYGYSREELLCRTVFDLRSDGSRPVADGQFREVLAKGALVFETEHLTRDGRLFPVEVSSSGVEFQGRTYVQSIVRDQSELVAARRRLERQRDLYDMLSRCNHAIARLRDRASLYDAVTRVAVEHGRFLFAWIAEPQQDGAVQRVAAFGDDGGYLAQLQVTARADDPRGHGPTGHCLRDGDTVVINRFLDDPRTRLWHDLAARAGIRGSAAVAVRVRGAVVAALMVYAAEPDFFDAEIVRTLEEVAAEISFGLEAIEVRKELEESRNLLQTVIDASATPVYAFDRQGRALLMNAAGARVMDRPGHGTSDERIFATGETLYVEESVGAGNQERTFLSVKFPLRDLEGRVYAVGGVSTEITELRRAQREVVEANARLELTVAERTQELVVERDRAEQADRAKTAFLSTVSHELRTPLNSIIGFTDIVLGELSGPLNEEQRRHLTIVQDSSRLLLALINEILDLSRIEAGRMQFSVESFDLADVLLRRLEAFASQADAKGLRLHSDLAPDLGTMFSDPKRVAQIVANLLSNAVKFTETGSVCLGAARDADRVRIDVRDTGPGIAPADLAQLFKPFMQVGDAQGRHREGTGLGLAISRHLARALGGDIAVESEPGRGTTFTVTLPLRVRAPVDTTTDTGLFRRLNSSG
ncbi:MAG TPA: ATP-binding protein [Steroidobacteraceae bacterium]|nr:ATP-binding protein [Steroidobacteraceae bacterium]